MAETTSFLVLGLGVTFGVFGLYVVSLFLRLSNADKDIHLINNLRNED